MPTYVATQRWPFGRSQMMGYRSSHRSPRPTFAGGWRIEAGLQPRRADALEAVEISAPGAPRSPTRCREWYGDELPSGPDGAGRN